jgi:hypothetical protein
MPTFEHYLAYGLSKAKQTIRSIPRRIRRAIHTHQYGIADLGDLWPEPRAPDTFGAVVDMLGFSDLMRREPRGAHLQMSTFQNIVSRALDQFGNGNVQAALVSDSAFFVSESVHDIAAVTMAVIYRCFLSAPTMLVHGYVDRGDYRLFLPLPGTHQNAHLARIHWAGQGVLGIGTEEMFLPKGAAIFLSPRVPADGLPIATHRLLWTTARTLDWSVDVQRAPQLSAIWNNVNHNCPRHLEHVAATKRWLRAAGARLGVTLAKWPA